MAVYTDEVVQDKIEVYEDGTIRVREVTRVYKDSVLISSMYTNSTLIEPGGSTNDVGDVAKKVASVVHTLDTVTKYNAKVAAVAAAENAKINNKGEGNE